MKKNVNLCLDAVRADLRDKRGEYQNGAELMEDITKAIFWAGVENDPFGKSEDFNSLDIWSMFGETCKLDRYADYSREYLATAQKNIITSCYVAEKVINYIGKQFRRYTASDIYGIANCELEFYLVNRLANEVFIGKEVDYTCVNTEDEKYLTLEILDKINVIIQ